MLKDDTKFSEEEADLARKRLADFFPDKEYCATLISTNICSALSVVNFLAIHRKKIVPVMPMDIFYACALISANFISLQQVVLGKEQVEIKEFKFDPRGFMGAAMEEKVKFVVVNLLEIAKERGWV